jgi:hypothetical protein
MKTRTFDDQPNIGHRIFNLCRDRLHVFVLFSSLVDGSPKDGTIFLGNRVDSVAQHVEGLLKAYVADPVAYVGHGNTPEKKGLGHRQEVVMARPLRGGSRW